MANKTEVKDAPVRDEMQVSLGPDPAMRKVDLDLDDAPFLKEQDAGTPAVADEKNLPAEETAAPGAKKKTKLLVIGGAAVVLLLVLGAAAWWFFLRTPPTPPAEIKPEVIVVPSSPKASQPAEYVKELGHFVVPRNVNGVTRFLVCKFSTISKSAGVSAEMDHKMISLRDALYFYLSGKSDGYLLNPANAVTIKGDLTSILNDYLTQGRIDDVLFESYLNE
ncbi:MAG: flagellar basal body-associated FliL family protein [Desulfovibrio sp.]|nr:flagellar basal body-associated FliL family protein [Desulfovibrio sp.]